MLITDKLILQYMLGLIKSVKSWFSSNGVLNLYCVIRLGGACCPVALLVVLYCTLLHMDGSWYIVYFITVRKKAPLKR